MKTRQMSKNRARRTVREILAEDPQSLKAYNNGKSTMSKKEAYQKCTRLARLHAQVKAKETEKRKRARADLRAATISRRNAKYLVMQDLQEIVGKDFIRHMKCCNDVL